MSASVAAITTAIVFIQISPGRMVTAYLQHLLCHLKIAEAFVFDQFFGQFLSIQMVLNRIADEIGGGFKMQFVEQPGSIGADGFHAQCQLVSDLPYGVALG